MSKIIANANPSLRKTHLIIYGRMHRLWNRKAAYIAAILTPILFFYGILVAHLVNVPFGDDYETVLPFMTKFAQSHGWQRFWLTLTFQHNEYRLPFENVVFALQYLVIHRPNFVYLCILGDLLVLAQFAAIWWLLMPSRGTEWKLYAAVPIAFLLFELRYAETLNWSQCALQHLAIGVAALLCVAALVRGRDAVACAMFALAIACSGNGFLLLPIGVWLLRRKIAALIAWFATFAAMVVVYSFHYETPLDPVQKHSLASMLSHLNPIYSLAFLGSLIGIHWVISASLGAALVAVVVLMRMRGYDRTNPTVFYFAIFRILTAIAAIRSQLGLYQSFTGRYRMNSILMFICAYLFAMERNPRWYRPALVASVIVCALADVYGHIYLEKRSMVMHRAAYDYSHGLCTGDPICEERHDAVVESEFLYRLPVSYTTK
jgi:hypothetical protein